ncbi:hypothetical protein BD410DRAFT_368 [Rickenella mellea]|uniref:Uncharacterized protein n=1 Tax=Rickenella mellea TaxID=50990 RepID=A0A4R5XDA1_9AGAM|nr:hypothetical protein BD410DRAFT_368 [Rickenella mellea]
MHVTLRLLSERVHKPLINFLGKRKWPTQVEAPHPHPAGSQEYKKSFADFVKRYESSGSSKASSPAPSPPPSTNHTAQSGAFSEFWQAPERLWKRRFDDTEIDAILSGGASLR